MLLKVCPLPPPLGYLVPRTNVNLNSPLPESGGGMFQVDVCWGPIFYVAEVPGRGEHSTEIATQFSGPESIEKINTFSPNLKLSGSSALQPESKMSAPLQRNATFRLGHPFGSYNIRSDYT